MRVNSMMSVLQQLSAWPALQIDAASSAKKAPPKKQPKVTVRLKRPTTKKQQVDKGQACSNFCYNQICRSCVLCLVCEASATSVLLDLSFI